MPPKSNDRSSSIRFGVGKPYEKVLLLTGETTMDAWKRLENGCSPDFQISDYELRYHRDSGTYTCDIVVEEPYRTDISCSGPTAKAVISAALAAIDSSRKSTHAAEE